MKVERVHEYEKNKQTLACPRAGQQFTKNVRFPLLHLFLMHVIVFEIQIRRTEPRTVAKKNNMLL